MTSSSSNSSENVQLPAQKFAKALDEGQLGMIHKKFRINVAQNKSSAATSQLYDIQGNREDIIRFLTSSEYQDECGGHPMTAEDLYKQYPQLRNNSRDQHRSS